MGTVLQSLEFVYIPQFPAQQTNFPWFTTNIDRLLVLPERCHGSCSAPTVGEPQVRSASSHSATQLEEQLPPRQSVLRAEPGNLRAGLNHTITLKAPA